MKTVFILRVSIDTFYLPRLLFTLILHYDGKWINEKSMEFILK